MKDHEAIKATITELEEMETKFREQSKRCDKASWKHDPGSSEWHRLKSAAKAHEADANHLNRRAFELKKIVEPYSTK